MKKIAIILLNYKSTKETLSCLKSLEKIYKKGFEYEVIVVDNSPDVTQNLLKETEKVGTKKNFYLIESGENTGFSGGNNIGMHHALANNFDYCLILNNDTEVDKNFLLRLLSTAESDNSIGIVVPKIYFAKGHEYHSKRYKESEKGKVIWYAGGIIDWHNIIGKHRGVDEVDMGQFDRKEETEYATGACMLIKKEVLEKAGMFDEDYFLYYEDSDLSVRVKKKGYRIIYDPTATIWHKNAASSGGSGSALQDYYTTRNRLLFGRKYAPLRSQVALTKQSLLLLVKGRKYQKRGVKDYYMKKFGKADFEIP